MVEPLVQNKVLEPGPTKILISEPRPLASGIIFAVVLTYLLAQPSVTFFYDAVGYWDLGHSYFSSGHFNFLDFNTDIPRGYLFPLLLGLLRVAAHAVGFDEQSAFFIVSAGSFAIFCGTIVPTLFKKVNGSKATLGQIGAFAVLFFYFWHGFLFQPLTDLPALYFSVTGCLLLLYFDKPRQFPLAIAGFACLSAATLTRPAYLATLITVAAAVFYFKKLWRQPKNALIMLFSAVLMVGLLWAPQLYLNKVKPPKVESDARKLHEFQLSFGIAWEKYETTVGQDLGGKPQVVYWNPLGTKIYQVEHLIAPFNLAAFWRVVKKYPMEIVAIYGKHLFNGLDLQFFEPYPEKIFANHLLFAFFNYCLLFCTITYLTGLASLKQNLRPTVLYLSMLSPTVLALPGVMETRFFLPIYLLAYGIFAFGLLPNPRAYFAKIRTPKMILAFVFTIWFAFTLSATTISTMQPLSPFLEGTH